MVTSFRSLDMDLDKEEKMELMSLKSKISNIMEPLGTNEKYSVAFLKSSICL